MEREILFRGKRVDNDEWVEGYYNLFEIGSDSIPIIIPFQKLAKARMSDVFMYQVDLSTVGRYTGLTDKNGRRIFEGDILDLTPYMIKDVGVVKFGEYKDLDMGNDYPCGHVGFYVDVEKQRISVRKDILFPNVKLSATSTTIRSCWEVTTMPKIKLKPCPFCGSVAKIRIEAVRGLSRNNIRYSAYCPECKIKKYRDLPSGSSDDAGDAVIDKVIEDWNRRTSDDNKALEPEYEGDGYDDKGELVYDTAYCPICHHEYEVYDDNHDNYCRNCGQKLDWRNAEAV